MRSKTRIVPSPIAATTLPAMTALRPLAARPMPGTALSALMAALAAVLTVPTSRMVSSSFFEVLPLPMP